MDLDALIRRYPRLYHMAECDTWPSIRRHGLLSSSEVLRRGRLPAVSRAAHRSEKVAVEVPYIGVVVLRDQKPMNEKRLTMALTDGTTPQEWYELINDRVFFWTREERLLGLLRAKHYRDLKHDVLTVDTASLLAVHAAAVSLCHMNSGNTFPIPHHRGRDAFCRIADYPVRRTGLPLREVVEVTVDDQVVDIAEHVIAVRRMRGATVLKKLPLR
jgi:hypothetical protein